MNLKCPRCQGTMFFQETEKVMVCGSCGFRHSSEIDERGKVVENNFSQDNLKLGKKFDLAQISN